MPHLLEVHYPVHDEQRVSITAGAPEESLMAPLPYDLGSTILGISGAFPDANYIDFSLEELGDGKLRVARFVQKILGNELVDNLMQGSKPSQIHVPNQAFNNWRLLSEKALEYMRAL